jgi:thiosulfate/3-mercaptopyruvate sulfurtransferase
MNHPVVSTSWLAEHLDDPNLRVFDSTIHLPSSPGERAGSGRDDFARAHIPGAGFLDLLSDLADTSSALPFTRPSREQLERAFSRAGVDHESHVVAYSSSNVMWATRLWWMLRSAGHERVAVLDGGFSKWCGEGRPTSTESCAYPETDFEAELRESYWASKDEVQAAIGDNATCTVNALPRALHTGEAEMGYSRPGHIEGSENVPFHLLLDSETGELKSPVELREHFEQTGAFARARVINYCGGGIAATLNALALTLAGHPNVAVYDGSLNEWSADPKMQMRTGTNTSGQG